MEDAQVSEEWSARASRRIAADPAFSALDATGAPIFVLAASEAFAGDPLDIVYMNRSARAVFGDDARALAVRLLGSGEPGGRRLAELIESIRENSTLRLERLRLMLDAVPQTVTVLCRRLADDSPACFAIAALGVRPAAGEALAGETLAPVTPPAERVGPAGDRGAQIAARHGMRSPRFLWKTDAEGRFIDVTHILSDVVGEPNADILGRSVGEVARDLGLDSAFAKAVASGKSWSGLEIDWPLDEPHTRVPATLGALPVTDAERRFAGYQGYGVLHLDRVYTREAGTAPPPPKAALAAPQPVQDAAAPVQEVAAKAPAPVAPQPPAEPPALIEYPDNIVRLRPPTARFNDLEPVEDSTLTSTERTAFEEIAKALREGGHIDLSDATADESSDDLGDATPDQTSPSSPVETLRVVETPKPAAPEPVPVRPPPPALVVAPPQTPAPPPAQRPEPVLDRLPVGVLVARGAQTLFVNRTLLDYLGYADRDAFENDGGLARMFFGRTPAASEAARPVAVQASDGEALDADAHLQIIDWENAPATLLTLRRNRFTPKHGPEESALALARGLEEKLSRARAEARLLEAAFEHSHEATAILSETGRIEKANAAFESCAGADKQALEGRNIASLLAPDSVRALVARLSNMNGDESALLLSMHGRNARLEMRMRRLDARRIAVSLREPVIRGNDELDAARQAAENASAAKSDFLARVSHEIRTPLNAIIGFAEVMLEERLGPIGSERYKEYLKDVHASGGHVLSLVNDLLDLSKIEAGKLELVFDRVDANAVIAECASIMQTQANRNRVLMRLALAPQLPPVRADQRSLKQILLNLLSNAVKFNEPGGQVIISSALTDAGSVVIRVKDTGIGMSAEEVETALEPFKQIATTRASSQQQRGTGLGLPLTKALIEANHASFTIRSRQNEGTLIEIAFPPLQVLAAE